MILLCAILVVIKLYYEHFPMYCFVHANDLVITAEKFTMENVYGNFNGLGAPVSHACMVTKYVIIMLTHFSFNLLMQISYLFTLFINYVSSTFFFM